jgi:hypothetical protein
MAGRWALVVRLGCNKNEKRRACPSRAAADFRLRDDAWLAGEVAGERMMGTLYRPLSFVLPVANDTIEAVMGARINSWLRENCRMTR